MVANRGPVTSGVTLALMVVATVFILARFYTRIFLVKSVKQDDWWILSAWLFAVGFSAAICSGVENGLGMHWTDVINLERDDFRRAQYAYSILYNPCLMLTKTSIIVFYLSVMSKDVDPIFRWLNWLTLAIVNIAGTALTFFTIFQCRPVSAGWQFPTPDGAKCTDIVTLYLSSAPVNILTDLALLLLPMPILTKLRLPKKQKIILLCTFSAGIFVAVVDVVRIAYLQNAALDRLQIQDTGEGTNKVVESSDFSWYASLSFMWSAIEVNVGIICACVPSLKPLFLKFAPNFIKDEGEELTSMDSLDMPGKEDNQPLSSMTTEQNVITNPAAFRRATISEYDGDDDGDYMGFLNMLSATEKEAQASNPNRSSTNTAKLSRISTADTTTSEFGFVKMDKNRNMLKLSNKQSLWPIAVVTFIFFLWGFAYGLLDVLNAQFQTIAKLSQAQALGLHGAYYGGYFLGPLTVGRYFLNKYGFKSTMICGLVIYGAGTLVFWPSAVLTSYAAFVVSNFIVGLGLSCLEISSNPYIALCGPLEYAECRLNFSQAFQAVGTVCSPLLARKVLFKDILNAPSLVNVQWAYLGISLFDFLLAIAFWYIPLPEADAEQLEEQADKRTAVYRTRIGGVRIIWWTLGLGVFAQWCYVGAQEGNGFNIGSLVTELLTKTSSSLNTDEFEALNHTTFAIGRFLGAFLNYLVKPRWILMVSFAGCIILSAIQMSADGSTGLLVNNLLQIFEGSIFPIVYAISLRGMGAQTFNAAAFLTSAISSGAVVPPIVWAVSNARGLKHSYSVILAIFTFGCIFPLYLNLVPAARNQVDPVHEARNRRRRNKKTLRKDSAFSEGAASVEDVTDKKFGLVGIIARRKAHHAKTKSTGSQLPTTEHVERPESDMMSPISPKQTRWDDDPPSPKQTRWNDSVPGLASPVRVMSKISQSSRGSNKAPRSISDSGESTRRHDWAHEDYGKTNKTNTDSDISGEPLTPTTSQVPREWTEEDDMRMDYHEALRGI